MVKIDRKHEGDKKPLAGVLQVVEYLKSYKDSTKVSQKILQDSPRDNVGV
jgi:hypothetical protein